MNNVIYPVLLFGEGLYPDFYQMKGRFAGTKSFFSRCRVTPVAWLYKFNSSAYSTKINNLSLHETGVAR